VNRIVIATVLVSLEVLANGAYSAESAGADSAKASNLEMTIRRFFNSQSGYEAGDLITRSQVMELQGYLRKTRRRAAASHPLILQRVLPDDCRFTKLFYTKNASDVLRAAAQKLGGYEDLKALTKPTGKYTQLVQAVNSGSADAVVKLAESISKARTTTTENGAGKQRRNKRTIYTVEDFLNAVNVAPAAKIPADEQLPSVQ